VRLGLLSSLSPPAEAVFLGFIESKHGVDGPAQNHHQGERQHLLGHKCQAVQLGVDGSAQNHHQSVVCRAQVPA